MSFQSPWLDLPIPITELVLERLPLFDYIRFSSICKKWYSIQKQHRIRHSPFPPPMQKPIPWLILGLPIERNEFLRYFSPFGKKCYPLTFLKRRSEIDCLGSSHGWLFLVDDRHYIRKRASLFNPLTKSQIKFPPFMANLSYGIMGVLSASPLNPDCVALILDADERRVFLCRVGQKQSKWLSFDVPYENEVSYFYPNLGSVYCDDKFYCIERIFFVIDNILTKPTFHILIMDCSQFPPEKFQHQTLIESVGEILMVVLIYEGFKMVRRFYVFKADFSKMMWVRVKNIGDRALFMAARSSICVSASEVGLKKNCVYYTDEMKECLVANSPAWSVFDIDTMERFDGPPFPYKPNCWFHSSFEDWFLPSLDYNI